MMSLVAFVFLCLLVAVSKKTWDQHMELTILKDKKLLTAGEDDEDVMAYLEASAVVSPAAKRALEGVKKAAENIVDQAEAKGLLDAGPSQWELMIADIKREEDDDHRLLALQSWLTAGVKMTDEELFDTINLFGVEGRVAARRVLLVEKKKAPAKMPEPIPPRYPSRRKKKA
jgi:hypothetical protein